MFGFLSRSGLERRIALSGGIYGCRRNWLTFHSVSQAVRRPPNQRGSYSMIISSSERWYASPVLPLGPASLLQQSKMSSADRQVYICAFQLQLLPRQYLVVEPKLSSEVRRQKGSSFGKSGSKVHGSDQASLIYRQINAVITTDFYGTLKMCQALH